MKLKAVMEYLANKDVGIIGDTLFVQDLPLNSGTPAIMLKNSLDPTDIDYELPGYRKGKFQAIIRCKAKAFEDGQELAELVSAALTLQEVTIGKYHYRYLRPVSEPVAYQLSDGANYEFSVNFSAVYVIVV